jgi:hypothetical protein
MLSAGDWQIASHTSQNGTKEWQALTDVPNVTPASRSDSISSGFRS